MHLFASSLEAFAAVTEDNRLKVWDVASGELQHDLKEQDHLSHKYTCIAWTQSSPTKKSAKRAKSTGLGIVALGTNTGSIVLWDLQKGQVSQTLKSDQSSGSAVVDVAFNNQGTSLYSTSTESKVLEWDIKTETISRRFSCGSEGGRKLAISADGEKLAVGNTAIRLFDLSSGKKSRKFTAGMSSAVHQLQFATDSSRFLFASTTGGRFISMYDLEDEDDEPVVNFSLPDTASSFFSRVTVTSLKSNKKKSAKSKEIDLFLSAVANSGDLFVWEHKYKESSKQPIAPHSKSQVEGSESSSAGVLRVAQHVDDAANLHVVRGSTLKPIFDKVAIRDNQNQLAPVLEFEPVSEHLLLSNSDEKSPKKAKKDDVEKHVLTLSERNGNGSVGADNSNGFEELEELESDDDNDVSLAERVDALRERVEEDVANGISHTEPEEKEESSARPDASSLSRVLEQALQTKDKAQLEYCLRTRDTKVVTHTVRRLPSMKVLQLLNAVVEKVERSPGRCARLCPWIRAILLHHTAYLIAQPNLVQSLSALYQTLEQRLKVHDQLQQLSGRLSLVIGQINEASAQKNNVDGDAPAAVVYKEGEEEMEEENGEENSGDEESEEGNEDSDEEGESDEE